MRNNLKHILLLIAFILLSLQGLTQGFQTLFGKSKVQYGKFEWSFYRTKSLEVYYYGGGRNLAQYTLAHADVFLEEIEEKLEYKHTDRIVIVIYNNYSDYRQSNIPLQDETYNTGGFTPIVDNFAFVYFNGNHSDFDNRIRAAITEVIINDMIYGGSIQERIQNAALITLPDWYFSGLISYMSKNWDHHKRQKLEDGILSKKYEKFTRLSDEEKTLISHSIWEYLDRIYGKSTLANILYLVKINKNMESGYEFVLGKSFNQIYSEWYLAYRRLLVTRDYNFQTHNNPFRIKRLHKKGILTQVKFNERGDKIALVTNKKGRYKIWIYDIYEEKKKRIWVKEHKREGYHFDMNYPLIAWNNRENSLGICFEKKAKPYLMTYNPDKKKKSEKIVMDRVEKILSIDYDNSGRRILMSAVKDGISDIYMYETVSRRFYPLSNDIFDDLSPRFIRNSEAIVFSSNRSDDTLRRKIINPFENFSLSFDIYYYDLKNKNNVLKRLSFTDDIDEFDPVYYDSLYVGYLTLENGIINKEASRPDSIFKHILVHVAYTDTSFSDDTFYYYKEGKSAITLDSSEFQDSSIFYIDTLTVYKDTAYTYPQSNYERNLLFYDVTEKQQKTLEVYEQEGRYYFSVGFLRKDPEANAVQRLSHEDLYQKLETIIEDTIKAKYSPELQELLNQKETEQEIQKDSFSYHFLSKYNLFIFDSSRIDSGSRIHMNALFKRSKQIQSEGSEREEYTRSRFGSSSLYFISFSPDYLISQFDNNFQNSPYLPFKKDEPIYPFNNVVNLMIKIGIQDLFKDYRISGGFTIKGNLDGAEYIMAFENLKRRLDKKFIFYRKGEKKEDFYTSSRELVHEGRFQLSYPFHEFSTMKLDFFCREDRSVVLSTENTNLKKPDHIMTYLGFKSEYIFDNSIYIATNIYEGTRFKVYYELFRNFENTNQGFSVIGADYRKYIPIHRNIIFASRFAGATSFGNSKIVFTLGGVDNWLFPRYNNNIQTDDRINYVYRSLAANMRGFNQNIRNGNSYALMNNEIRIPFVKYLYNRPIKSTFFEDLQLVLFSDIGTAWTGKYPHSDDNALNRTVIENNPLKIIVLSLGEPIVGGFGFGFRTSFLGYFVKVDQAWGVVSGKTQSGITYISFGLDF